MATEFQKAGITKRGVFVGADGELSGWETSNEEAIVLGANGTVFVGGLLNSELTTERQAVINTASKGYIAGRMTMK